MTDDFPGVRDEPGYDPQATAALPARALALPGGADLVIGTLARLPAAQHFPAHKGHFRSTPEQVQLADHRFHVEPDGRLRQAHVVEGVVIAQQSLPPDAAAAQVADAIAAHLGKHGAHLLPEVTLVLEGLATALG